jgi:hypothetical protein
VKRIHIVGVSPRTGTTLLAEAIVACYEIDLYAEHELRLIVPPESRARVFLTKAPRDIMMVGPRLKLDPDLHVICMLRDPRDIVTSKHGLEPDRYWCGLNYWKTYTQQLPELLPQPRFLLIRYEDLVRDPDTVQARISAALPFLDAIAPFSSYHKVATPSALSKKALGSVRRVSDAGVGRWRAHLPRVKGQIERHGAIADDLVRFGYERDDSWLEDLEGVTPDRSESVLPERFSRRDIRKLRRGRHQEAVKAILRELTGDAPWLDSLFKQPSRLKSAAKRLKSRALEVPARLQSDKQFCERQFQRSFGRAPDLVHPRTFNEKIQWRKLFDRKPIYTLTCDKWAVRDYVADRIGADHLIDLIAVVERPDQLDWDSLPSEFVIKATHGSKWTKLITHKALVDRKELYAELRGWLRRNYFWRGREWAYRDIPPRLVVERCLRDADGRVPSDYKFFCYHGRAHFLQIDLDRFGRHRRNIYDAEGNLLPVELEFPSNRNAKPDLRGLDKMVDIAEALSADFDFVRADLYRVDGRIYFGELTHYPGNGRERFRPARFDERFGAPWRVDRT